MAITISGDSPNLTSASLTTPTLTTPSASNGTFTSPTFAGTPTGVGVLTSGTAAASTSGTAIDFTSIPSWVKRITVMLSGVSTNSTSLVQLQLGDAGGFETASSLTGNAVLCKIDGNTWIISGDVAQQPTVSANVASLGGSKTLSDTLTQVRITTVGGTDTFDAGSINILYE